MLALCRIVLSTEPLQENKGDIMLPPQVVDFAADALASMGGTYTGEIEFSGGSARALRRLSRHTSQVEPFVHVILQDAPALSCDCMGQHYRGGQLSGRGLMLLEHLVSVGLFHCSAACPWTAMLSHCYLTLCHAKAQDAASVA